MVLEAVSVNWLAVIVASVASFVLGFIWYGPLFGKMWLKGSGMSDKEMKAGKKEMGKKMVINFIGTVVMVKVLAYVISWSGAVGFMDIAYLGLKLGVGFFLATTLLGDVTWKGRPWSFFWINAFFWTLNLIVAGYVYTLF